MNYILYNSKAKNLPEVEAAYETYFIKNNVNIEILDIHEEDGFKYFFENLEYGFEKLESEDGYAKYKAMNKVQYSYVDNIIMIFHANANFIRLTENDTPYEEQVIRTGEIKKMLSDCSLIKIKNIDLQCCMAGQINPADRRILAVELCMATHAECVYAATGLLIYSFNCNQVLGGAYYKFFLDESDKPVKEGGKAIFNVMYRWEDEHAPRMVFQDYPV